MRVYGSTASYFTGKLEGYLRCKAIPYEHVSMTSRDWSFVVPRATGAKQMPAVLLGDGRWMTDTTPIIAWLEAQYPEPAVIPHDPALAFMSRLLEDYADEWLWRPAMHYRWSHRTDARLMSHWLATEILADVPAPLWLRRWIIYRRQHGWFVRADGVTPRTRTHVEGIYLRTLASLEAIVTRRPFLLGDVPTLADFGFFGSMFRHFASDPTGRAVMQREAPGVFEWVARVWNGRAHAATGRILDAVPDDWGPILDDLGSAYLPYLCANADAWKAGRKRFDVVIQGTTYVRVPTSRYRVWCLEELRRHHDGLADGVAAGVRARLERHGCWEPLWRVRDCRSGYDPGAAAPFARGLAVFQ